MKSFKVMVSLVALFLINNAFAIRYSATAGTSNVYTPTVMPEDYVEPNQSIYSFEIILKGGLGKDATSKVRQIFYSGNAARASELKEKLNVALRSRYQNDQDRIARLKEIINELYESFMNR
jgi:hypothetical protein